MFLCFNQITEQLPVTSIIVILGSVLWPLALQWILEDYHKLEILNVLVFPPFKCSYYSYLDAFKGNGEIIES